MISMSVVFVLPVKGGGGGAHSVAQEVNELIRMGVDAKIAVNQKNYPSFVTCYSDMPAMHSNIVSFKTPDDLGALLSSADHVVCTLFTSVKLVSEALQQYNTLPKFYYYAQDYEPLFVLPDSPLWQEAYDSYTLIKDMVVFAKTNWIREVVKTNHDIEVRKVSPSIDHDVYFPSFDKSDTDIWITAMVRTTTPRRAPKRTMKVLKNLVEKYGAKVNINIFGSTDESIYEDDLPRDFLFFNHGILSRKQVSSLLRRSHIFLDLSDYQAFGRTGLEAMACGCPSVVPIQGGTGEYIEHGVNGYAVDSRNEHQILDQVSFFIDNFSTIGTSMSTAAINTSLNFSVRKAALSIHDILSEG